MAKNKHKPLPPFLARLAKTNPAEFRRMLEIALAGMDKKTWEKIKEEYRLDLKD